MLCVLCALLSSSLCVHTGVHTKPPCAYGGVTRDLSVHIEVPPETSCAYGGVTRDLPVHTEVSPETGTAYSRKPCLVHRCQRRA